MAKVYEIKFGQREREMSCWMIVPENAREDLAIAHGAWSNPICDILVMLDMRIDSPSFTGPLPIRIHVLLTKDSEKIAEELAQGVAAGGEIFDHLLKKLNLKSFNVDHSSIRLVLNRWALGLD